MSDLDLAKTMLAKENLTLTIAKNGTVIYKTKTKGVTGFLEAIRQFGKNLTNSSAADKVVGKAIALLCIYAKIKSLYAKTLSSKAKELLKKTGISLEYDTLISNVVSFDKTDICPFEKAVADISDPSEAYAKLKSICKLREHSQATQ